MFGWCHNKHLELPVKSVVFNKRKKRQAHTSQLFHLFLKLWNWTLTRFARPELESEKRKEKRAQWQKKKTQGKTRRQRKRKKGKINTNIRRHCTRTGADRENADRKSKEKRQTLGKQLRQMKLRRRHRTTPYNAVMTDPSICHEHRPNAYQTQTQITHLLPSTAVHQNNH